MAATLTAKQAEALALVSEGKVTMHNTGYSSWRIAGASPTVVGRLVSMGLARWPKGPVGAQACEITDEGRAALPPRLV